jgi:hypothetical protein
MGWYNQLTPKAKTSSKETPKKAKALGQTRAEWLALDFFDFCPLLIKPCIL